MPAATSRTPPIRSAPAPRPAPSPRWSRAGGRRIAEILVLGDGAGLVTPCGACRQRIREFAEPRDRRSTSPARRACAAASPSTRCCRTPSARTTSHERGAPCSPDVAVGGGRRPAAGRGFERAYRLRDRHRHRPRRPGRRARRTPSRSLCGDPGLSRAPASRGHARAAVMRAARRTPVLVLRGPRPRLRARRRRRDARAHRSRCAALGARALLLTNAAGSLMPEAGPGSLVAHHRPHQPVGLNPLIGEPSDARFVADGRCL